MDSVNNARRTRSAVLDAAPATVRPMLHALVRAIVRATVRAII